MMYVRCICSCRSSSRLRICACTDTSSADVGSSRIMIFGDSARALAMAMRCSWPPESWCGKLSRYFRSILTISSTSFAFSLALLLGTPWMIMGRMMELSTVSLGFRFEAGSWNTTAISRCSLSISLWLAFPRLTPSMTASPPVIFVRDSSTRASVVLPEPDSPTRPTISPSSTDSVMWSTAFTCSPEVLNRPLDTRKYFCTSFISIMGALMRLPPFLLPSGSSGTYAPRRRKLQAASRSDTVP